MSYIMYTRVSSGLHSSVRVDWMYLDVLVSHLDRLISNPTCETSKK
jgi:hypothetical protein